MPVFLLPPLWHLTLYPHVDFEKTTTNMWTPMWPHSSEVGSVCSSRTGHTWRFLPQFNAATPHPQPSHRLTNSGCMYVWPCLMRELHMWGELWSEREGSAEPARYKRDEREAKQEVEEKRERRWRSVCGGRGGMGGWWVERFTKPLDVWILTAHCTAIGVVITMT